MWCSVKLPGTGSLRLRIAGELDVTTIPALERMLTEVLDHEPCKLELELSGLRMIDSTGVGALVRLSRRLRACGCLLAICGLRDQSLAVFRLLRLDGTLGDFDREPRWS